jgi:hypothetical protein
MTTGTSPATPSASDTGCDRSPERAARGASGRRTNSAWAGTRAPSHGRPRPRPLVDEPPPLDWAAEDLIPPRLL